MNIFPGVQDMLKGLFVLCLVLMMMLLLADDGAGIITFR